MMPLKTERLIVRNWQKQDSELFFRINSEPRVMAFFPFRRDRAASDRMMEEVRRKIDRKGYGFMAVESRSTGACLGFVGLQEAALEPVLPADTFEIGWRLAPEFWGKGFACEAAREILRFGFQDLQKDEIVSFAVWNNHRSTAVMRRLGMRHDPAGDFDHPRVPDSHAQLKRHVLYRLSRQDWLESVSPSAP